MKLGRSGAFWQTEYWDRFIRNDAHFSATEDYIDHNPVKAGLVREPQLWPYGSARLKA
jgi:REP element-mobilizing transposase RayT